MPLGRLPRPRHLGWAARSEPAPREVDAVRAQDLPDGAVMAVRVDERSGCFLWRFEAIPPRLLVVECRADLRGDSSGPRLLGDAGHFGDRSAPTVARLHPCPPSPVGDEDGRDGQDGEGQTQRIREAPRPGEQHASQARQRAQAQ